MRVIKDAQEEVNRKQDVKVDLFLKILLIHFSFFNFYLSSQLQKLYGKVVARFNKKPKDGIRMLLKEKQYRFSSFVIFFIKKKKQTTKLTFNI